jgi:adenylylsulfate kinase-like enzyme
MSMATLSFARSFPLLSRTALGFGSLFPAGDFLEIQVVVDRDEAMRRDPKGLYAKAARGEIRGLTGFDAEHELSDDAELTLRTDERSVDECVDDILNLIRLRD